MATIIQTSITYLKEDDLFLGSRNKLMKDISRADLKDRNLFLKSEVVLLRFKGEYKVLKSRY